MTTILSALVLSSCSIFGISDTPETKYTNISTEEDFSIREYDPVVQAQVTVESSDYKTAVNKGFKELFKYITGANTSNQKISMTTPVTTNQSSQEISMTAPVLMKSKDNSWTIAFVLPADMNIDNAPKPTNDKVKLVEIPKTKVAVITFNGSMTQNQIDSNTDKLRKWIDKQGLKAIGQPQAAGYNPPWTLPFLRTNEVMIAVK